MDINTLYDTTLKTVLEERLKRQASSSELMNADNDSDLVNEVFWRLILQLNERVNLLESKNVV